jgi:tripartite-type tricarboxylate transporter receptor subunit TctC
VSTRRRTLLQGAAAFAALPLLARAQGTWPNKPIRVIVPFTPGGTTDFVARLVGVELSKTLGQPVIVDNKPGAGTVIGVDAAAKAAPDGYTFVCVANSFTANQTLIRKLPYDTQKDLRPVALMGMSEHVLATHPASDLKTLADLRNAAKAKPGTLSFASFGNGTSAHLSGEMLKLQMGLDIVHVPYKGQGPALTDLLGGQVDVLVTSTASVSGLVQNGKLRVLAVTSPRRIGVFAKVPTLEELGYAGARFEDWYGFFAPAGTPPERVAYLNEAIVRTLHLPEVTKLVTDGGSEVVANSSEAFAAQLRQDIERWSRIVKLSGARAD